MIIIREYKNGDGFVFEEDGEQNFMGKNPTFGYEEEFVEKRMLSGLIRRIYKGKRFVARVSFGTLLPANSIQSHEIGARANGVYWLLDKQRSNGYLYAEVTDPESKTETFKGNVFVDLDSSRRRFKWDTDLQDYVWTNYQLVITACDLKE